MPVYIFFILFFIGCDSRTESRAREWSNKTSPAVPVLDITCSHYNDYLDKCTVITEDVGRYFTSNILCDNRYQQKFGCYNIKK
jgi:hypothetical protein